MSKARQDAELLVTPLGRRWIHVQAVAQCAQQVCDQTALRRDVLVVAAWLHDIGYALDLQDTGFHPVDGARHLRRQGMDERVVSLVAHHSCARVEADIRGLGDSLDSEFARPEPEYEDALCFCDMTNGPAGDPVTASDRLDEIEARYGLDHPTGQFVDPARAEILAMVERVERRLSESQASFR